MAMEYAEGIKLSDLAKVYRFRRPRTVSLKRQVALLAAGVLVGLLVAWAVAYFRTNQARLSLELAVQQADAAIASGDYIAARDTLARAIAAVPRRSDKARLTAAASQRMEEIAAKATEQEAARAQARAERKEAERQAAEAAARRKHEWDGLGAVADVRAKIGAGEYQMAVDAAGQAIRDFADTPSAKELIDLLATATEKLKAVQDARARHDRFVKYRDAGLAAFKAGDREFALIALSSALKEEEDAGVRRVLEQYFGPASRPDAGAPVAVGPAPVPTPPPSPDGPTAVAPPVATQPEPQPPVAGPAAPPPAPVQPREAAPPAVPPAAAKDPRRLKHEQDAAAAVANLKALIAAKNYKKAMDAAEEAIAAYWDTPSGTQLDELWEDADSIIVDGYRARPSERYKVREHDKAIEDFWGYVAAARQAEKKGDYKAALIAYGGALRIRPHSATYRALAECKEKQRAAAAAAVVSPPRNVAVPPATGPDP